MVQTICVLTSHRRSSASAGHRHGSQFRNRTLKHVQRAHIVLCSADRLPAQEVARRAGVSRPAVWRWQARSAEQGVDGLLRDKTRKRRPRSAFGQGRRQVMDLTLAQRRRGLFLRHHAPPDPTRSVPFRRPFAERDHTLHRLPQQRLSTVPMDHFRQSDLRKIRPDPCTFCLKSVC